MTVRRELLGLYHAMPPTTRSIVASAWGLYLRITRFGTATRVLAAAAAERDRWSAQQWSAFSAERLAETLHHAATRVPYYRDAWSKRRQAGDRRSWEQLEHWPVLHKEAIRAHPRAFVADGFRPEKMFAEHTSGTTGTPLTLWLTREAVQHWYALFSLRTQQWYGVDRHDRWAMAGGQLVAPVDQAAPPFWVWNLAMRQLYLSSYHLAPRFIPAYLEAMRRHRVKHLLAYTSSAYALAQGALASGEPPLRLAVVVTCAEPLYQHQRDVISRAFDCPVRETYSLSENVAAASECEAGTLHWWPDVGTIETLRDEERVPDGQIGDIVCTGYINRGMPLIRYRVGDTAALAAAGSSCSCGRTLPILRSVEGRSDDVLVTPDGRLVGRLDTVFKSDLPIREAQIIQETRSRVRVLYIPAAGYDARTGSSLAESLRARMGDVEVVLEAVASIPRTANGKFRAVRTLLSAEERQGAVPNVRT